MIVLLIRWIPFTGTNDFGWTYDVANRMLSGSRLYSDISINIGPVSFLTLSWLMKLMGNSIIVYNMHLYIWYLLCIIASYYSLRKIVDREELFISLLIAVLIGFPVVNAFHVYNYSSTFFFILGVTALVKYQTRNHVKYIFFVGVIAVLCLLNKQNVGFAYFGLSNIFLVFHSIGRPIKNIISHLIVLYVSTLLSLITAAIIFEIYFDLGYGEFINVLLIEATSGKQGLVKIIARTIPWIKANIGL